MEDQEQVRRLAVDILKNFGYEVLEASNPDEALRLFERHDGPIQLLLTDVAMPGMTGCALADRLLPARPEMSVVYMSGYADRAIAEEEMKRPGTIFLQKPFTPAMLAAKLRDALHRPQARVLVVDDEASVRHFFHQVLDEAGYDVVEAANGKQAMESIRAEKIDLVVTDLVMPEQEGVETIVAMRREFPALKIVAVTGAFGGQFLRIAQLMGAMATLRKPAAPQELLRVVREVLKRDPPHNTEPGQT